MSNNVNSPNHYTSGYFETIYEIADILGPEGFKAFCLGNAIKYNARASNKGGAEDLEKAANYLDWHTNGLPAPVDGRLPNRTLAKPEVLAASYAGNAEAAAPETDPYAAVAAKLYGKDASGAGNTDDIADARSLFSRIEVLEREKHEHAVALAKQWPTTSSLIHAIGPAVVELIGSAWGDKYSLRLNKHVCDGCSDRPEAQHVWYSLKIVSRENRDYVFADMCITDLDRDPDEDAIHGLAVTVATVLNNLA